MKYKRRRGYRQRNVIEEDYRRLIAIAVFENLSQLNSFSKPFIR